MNRSSRGLTLVLAVLLTLGSSLGGAFISPLGVPSAAAIPVLSLPFPAGQSKLVTQYPHDLSNAYLGYAVDLAMKLDDPVAASASGVVRVAGMNNAAPSINGNQVIIDHGGNFCTQYNHLNRVDVVVGQEVKGGAILGGAGSTGMASGVHLHWNTISCDRQTTLGPLVTAEYPSGFGAGEMLRSQNGQEDTGIPVSGAIGTRWRADGGAAYYGLATTPEFAAAGGGAQQRFEKGSIYWISGNNGAWGVRGGILTKWRSTGSEGGVLRYPSTRETTGLAGSGAVQAFQQGDIYWTPAKKAFVVRAGIRAAWLGLGGHLGVLGYPVSDETGGLRAGGAVQAFQRGEIYWTAQRKAIAIRGAIKVAWHGMAAQDGVAGYPLGNEYKDASGNAVQDFEVGRIFWNAVNGAWYER